LESITKSLGCYFLVVLLILLARVNADDCRIVINELNAVDPVKIEKKEFIEIAQLCSGTAAKKIDSINSTLGKKSLQGYKIVAISHMKSLGFCVAMVANLWNSHIVNNNYFTLGGVAVDNADIKFTDPMVKSRGKFTKGNPSISNFLQNANTYPSAVAILFSKNGVPEIDLSEKQTYLTVTSVLEPLRLNIKDLIVYGRRATPDQCSVFEQLCDDYNQDRKYILREYDSIGKTYDRSLNRCGLSTEAFLPEMFKLGKPTPGSDNDCSQGPFVLADHMMKVADPVIDEIMDFELQGCSADLPPSFVASAQSDLVERAMQTELSSYQYEACEPIYFTSDVTKADQSVRIADERVEAMDATPEPIEWDTTFYFKEKWVSLMENHQKNLIPIRPFKDPVNQEVRKWFEYLPNPTHPQLSKYQCRLCAKYYDKFMLAANYKPNVASPFLGTNYNNNQEVIRKHFRSRAHQAVIATLITKTEKQLEGKFDALQEKIDAEDKMVLQITARMFRTVFVEQKANVPFDSHKMIVALQKKNSAVLGVHHYGRTAATEMVELMSNEMHKILLNEMVLKKMPCSIIVDSSTDSSGYHYLIVYFQTLENEHPVMYFYRLVLLGVDETSVGLLRSLNDTINNDSQEKDFRNYLVKHLIGYSSDGASVMMGKYNGFHKKLEEEFGIELYAVHCMAHRLHLALRKPFDKISLLSTFEDTVDSISNFYNNKGHKRKAHLRATALYMRLDLSQITYIFKELWISSEFTAIQHIKKIMAGTRCGLGCNRFRSRV